MKKNVVTVMGATGQIGTKLTKKLLERGAKVRALGRERNKLESLRALGAEVVQIDFADAKALAASFAGSDAVFTFVPPSYDAEDFGAYQDRVSLAIVDAVKSSGVRKLVNMSSLGAHLEDHTGPIKGLYRHERRLDAIAGIDIVHLRPSSFLENQFWNIPTIKSLGINGSPLQGDKALPMVATADIAEKAADLLLSNFLGRSVFELVGQKDYTLDEVTRVLGAAIGKADLKYVAFPYADAEKAMISSGMKPDITALLIEMNRSLNDGVIQPTQELTAVHRGKTTLEMFAAEFARAYRAE